MAVKLRLVAMRAGCALLVFTVSLVALHAQTAEVGAISGTVVDSTGAVLPGVTVVLSNPGTIGGNRQVITDDRGVYQFTRLVPSSTYSVRAELSGFRPFVRDGLVVVASATVRADIRLEVGSMTDAITVSGQVPLLDTTTTANQTVLSRETLDTFTTTTTIWWIGRDRAERGDEPIRRRRVRIAQPVSRQRSWQPLAGQRLPCRRTGYDESFGHDVSDLLRRRHVRGNQLHDRLGGAPSTKKSGLVYNLVSKTGTNKFRGWASFTGTDRHFNAANLSAQQEADLIASVPPESAGGKPRIRAERAVADLLDISLG